MASAGDIYQVGQWWCSGTNIASKATLTSVEYMASATGIYRMAGWTSVEGMAFKADIASGGDMGDPPGFQDEQHECGGHG